MHSEIARYVNNTIFDFGAGAFKRDRWERFYIEKIGIAQVSIALFVVGVDTGDDNSGFDLRLFWMLWVKLNLA